MASLPKEMINELTIEFKDIIEAYNHLQHTFDRLFDNVEEVQGAYTATEAEMVIAQAVEPYINGRGGIAEDTREVVNE